jgi:hypothetical protein
MAMPEREIMRADARIHIVALARYRAQISRLRDLGTSLADVAAFMQEIELQEGFFTPRLDGRGIERLRFLAMQFEGMGVKTVKADVSPPRYHQQILHRFTYGQHQKGSATDKP